MIGFALLLAATSFFALLAARPTEPTYKGKPLSFWITKYESYSVYPHNNQAWDAVQAIGTNAIPVMIRWISYQTPKWRQTLALLERKYVHTDILALRYPPEHDLANQCLSILSTNAPPALPAFVKLMNETASHPCSQRRLMLTRSFDNSPQTLS
jgi:hypothetical protein